MPNTIQPRELRPVYTVSGNNPFVIVHPEAALQTYQRGAVLGLDGAARVVEATSPNPSQILGVAEADGQNDPVAGNSNARVMLANTDTVFVANLTTGQVSALTDLGQLYGLIKVGNFWRIDKTAVAANGRVIITGFYPDDAIGDIQARLMFIFNQRTTRLAVTS